MDCKHTSSPAQAPSTAPAATSRREGDVMFLAYRATTVDELQQLFNTLEVAPDRQKEIIEQLFYSKSDLGYRRALANHLREMVETEAMLREALGRFGTSHSDTPPTSATPSPKPYTFRLTPRGKETPKKAWDEFLDNLVGMRMITKPDLAGFRSLLGLSDEPLRQPVDWGGSLQQLMLVFSALYGTLNYVSRVDLDVLHRGERYTFPARIATPAGGGLTAGRNNDPYCVVLASAVLVKGKVKKPHDLTSAKSTLEATDPAAVATVKSLKPHLAAQLIRLLQALP